MRDTLIRRTVACLGLVAIAAAVATGFSVDKSFSTSNVADSGGNPGSHCCNWHAGAVESAS